MDELLQARVERLVEVRCVVPYADLLVDLIDEKLHLLPVFLHWQHHSCKSVLGQLEALSESQSALQFVVVFLALLKVEGLFEANGFQENKLVLNLKVNSAQHFVPL